MSVACQTQTACDADPNGIFVAENADDLRHTVISSCTIEAILLGLVAPLDGGSGKYFYDAANTDPDDGVITLVSAVAPGAWVKHSA